VNEFENLEKCYELGFNIFITSLDYCAHVLKITLAYIRM